MEVSLHVAISVPEERVREFDLEFLGPEILIGRDRECEIQIPLSEVSRVHAKIFKANDQWFIKDLDSASGTKVNDQALAPQSDHLLAQGDVIEIAHATITFSLIDHAGALENTEEGTSVVAQKLVREILADPHQSVEQPYFVVMKGPNEGSRLLVHGDLQEFLIGRVENADLYLDDPNVSRKHARLKREWNELLIEDLGSKNGVVVNGRKIALPTRLRDSDEVYLGSVRLTYVDPTAKILNRLEISAASEDEPTFHTEVSVAPSVAQPKALPRSARLPERSSVMSGFGVVESFLALFGAAMIVGLIYGLGLWLT